MDGKRTVMIVEDDDDIRLSLAGLLSEDGYDVAEARNGAEAMALLEHGPPPCVVLVDLMMPVMTGWELVDRMRADSTLAAVPIVVTSAAAQRSPPGVACVLPKPLDIEALMATVAEHCGSKTREPTRETETVVRELARRNIELVELQRFRDEMSALLVHDMRNPLGVILANLDFILNGRRGQDEAEKREALLDTQKAAERIKRLLQNLLDLVGLEAGRLLPHRTTVAVAELIAPLLERRAAACREQDVTIRAVDITDVRLDIDTDLLSRTVENVLDNAFRYMPSGGRIEISAALGDKTLAVRIGNSGPAIPLAARTRIFEKFAQAGDGAGRMNLGLGLYFCRLVLEAHGGKIWVEETADLPAVFVLELPV